MVESIAMESALQAHQSGDSARAEIMCREILARNPDHPDALCLLGTISGQRGQFDAAVDLLRQAVRLNPDHADAHYKLGIALQGAGKREEAIASYQHALRLNPDFADAHYNLGVALESAGQVENAIASYIRTIQLKPDESRAHFNLGIARHGMGRLDEAVASYRQAVRFRPDFAEAHNNLGAVLKELGELDQAIAAYRRAVELKPDYADAHINLGVALQGASQFDEAIAAYRLAVRHKPDDADAHYNLGIALQITAKLQEAVASYRQAIRLRPDRVEAHSNLGVTLKDMGELDEATIAYQQAIQLKPDLAEAHHNLGNALKGAGRLDEAIAAFREAIRLKPDFTEAHGNLLIALNYRTASDPQSMYVAIRQWNQRHAGPLRKYIQPHTNDRDALRPLRIGYVSADFCEHASAFFLLPLFRHHDRKQFDVTCYAQLSHCDKLTEQMQSCVQRWRKIEGCSDAQVAAQVREDGIDILVDLKLHTGGNRLLVFARKPAPVQVTWLGYPGTTGLETIDYRLTDPYLDPPGSDDSVYTERSFRLPHTFWCYDPLAADPAVSTLPCLRNRFLTFGCLNNFCKVNDAVLSLWARVLSAVPASRLLLLAPRGRSRDHVLGRLGNDGVGPERVEFTAMQPRPGYLRTYHRIDIALDTFPYNGHTTSLDSFWMGVPVVTLLGRTVVGRAGRSQLSNLKLTELAARTEDQFVRMATELAGDIPRLAELRRTLRPRMQASPLMDAPRFARDIEAAYRQMWMSWCSEPA